MSTLLNHFGDYLLEKALVAECKQAGLVSASARLSFGNIEYFRSDSDTEHPSEAIVMLHGAASDKTSWTRFAKKLRSKFQIMIPDLPGHGKSVADITLNYSINSQADRLREFLSELGITRIHLIGNSMGGTIAAHLASTSPNIVASIVLVDAAGFGASPSWLQQHVAHTGINPMIELSDTADYRAMMNIGMESPPYVPGIILSALARAFVKRKTINQKIVEDIEKDINQLESLSKIVAPALIIWGAADKVEHVDNAELLHKQLSGSRKIVIDGIGHVPMVESPKKVADICNDFYIEVAM